MECPSCGLTNGFHDDNKHFYFVPWYKVIFHEITYGRKEAWETITFADENGRQHLLRIKVPL